MGLGAEFGGRHRRHFMAAPGVLGFYRGDNDCDAGGMQPLHWLAGRALSCSAANSGIKPPQA